MSGISNITTFGPRKPSRLALMGIRFANDEDDKENGAGGGAGGGSWEAPKSQEDLDRIVNTRLSRERDKFKDYDDLKDKATKFDALQQNQQSQNGTTETENKGQSAQELEDLRKKLETVEQTGTETSIKLLRADVALDKGIGKEDLDLLTATTEDGLKKQADRIIALRGAAKTSSQRVPGQGGGGGDESGLDAGKSEYEKRHPKKQ